MLASLQAFTVWRASIKCNWKLKPYKKFLAQIVLVDMNPIL